jgi:DNA repair protein RecO (recombination protein O)
LLFLIRLSDLLGFGPAGSLSLKGEYFDMLTGTVEENNPSNVYIISGDLLALIRKLSPLDYPDLTNFTASRKLVLDLLNRLLDYYRIHLPEMAELKSVKVLGEIMG